MTVEDVDAADERALATFVALERRLHAGEPRYVAPLDDDVKRLLDRRSAFADGVDMRLLLARDDAGRPVARAAAFVNERWQRAWGERAGFVGFLAAAADAGEPFARLLAEAERHLGQAGCTRAVAGVNATGQVGLGILTAAFDEDPMFPLSWNPPHLGAWLDAAGWRRAYPLYVYDVDFATPAYVRRRDRALDAPGCRLREVDRSRWGAEIEVFREIFNAAFAREWEFNPYTSAEFAELYGPLRRLLDPSLFVFAEVEGRPAGACMGFLDWTPAFRMLDGRFGPLKALRFRRAIERSARAGLITIAVDPAYHGRGVGAALAARLFANLERLGFRRGLYYLVNEVNAASRGLAESFGGVGRVLYHCFDKPLHPHPSHEGAHRR